MVLALRQHLVSCQVQESEPTKSPVSQEIIQVIRTEPGGIWAKKIRTENVARLHMFSHGTGDTFRSIDMLCTWEVTVELTQIKKPLGSLGKGTLMTLCSWTLEP